MLSKFSGYQARNPHLGTTLVWDFGKLKEIEAIEKLLKEVEVAGRWLWVLGVVGCGCLGFCCWNYPIFGISCLSRKQLHTNDFGTRKPIYIKNDIKNLQLGGGFKYFWNFHPELWGNDPIWLRNIFQMGWFNHQLVNISLNISMFLCFPQLCTIQPAWVSVGTMVAGVSKRGDQSLTWLLCLLWRHGLACHSGLEVMTHVSAIKK